MSFWLKIAERIVNNIKRKRDYQEITQVQYQEKKLHQTITVVNIWQSKVLKTDESPNSEEKRERARNFEKQAITLSKQAEEYRMKGCEEEALKYMRLAAESLENELNIIPINSFSLLNLGICYKYLGEVEKAIDALLASLLCEPTSPATHRELGLIYYKIGDIEMALKYLRQSLEQQDSSTVSAHMLLKEDKNHVDTHLTYAICLEAVEKWAEAIDAWKSIIAHMPNHPLPHAGLATVLFIKNPVINLQNALQEAEKAKQLDVDGRQGIRDSVVEFIHQIQNFQHGGQFIWKTNAGKFITMGYDNSSFRR